MKNFKKRKLSDNELDQVVSGYTNKDIPDDFKIAGMTQWDMSVLMQRIVDNFGTDIAIDIGKSIVPTNDWETWLRASEGCNPVDGYGGCLMHFVV